MDKVWMMPPFGEGEPKEVDGTPEVLVSMMAAGWNQCAPPVTAHQEVKPDVDD